MTPADFKRLSAIYLSEDHFDAYVKELKQEGRPEVQELRQTFQKKNGLEAHIAPLYRVSKQDAKDVVGFSAVQGNAVIGLILEDQRTEAGNARNSVDWLKEYAIDSILYGDLMERFRYERQQLEIKKLALEGQILENKRLLENYRQRELDLQHIAGRFPNAGAGQERQVISVTEDTAQYLPPQTLLATNEVQISRINEEIRDARLEQARIALLLKYHEALGPVIQSTTSGKKLLDALKAQEALLFGSKKQLDDVELEVRNSIIVDNKAMELLYLNKSRIVSMQTNSTARPVLMAAVGLALGLILAAMVSLLRRSPAQ